MRKIIFALLALFIVGTTQVFAQTKTEKRYTYTMKNLHLDKKTEAAFSPILKAYLNERKAAGDIYDDVKKKYQAKQLFEAKLESETKELAAKKKYFPEFLKVLKPKKVWYAFDLANDKMTTIDGSDSDE